MFRKGEGGGGSIRMGSFHTYTVLQKAGLEWIYTAKYLGEGGKGELCCKRQDYAGLINFPTLMGFCGGCY